MLTAIAVLVIGGLLGAAMVRLLRSGELAIAAEVVSTRALHAAESGAQRKANEVLFGAGAGACLASETWNLPASTVLSSCRATLSCARFVTASGEVFYDISSRGECGSGDALAARTIDVQLRE